MRKFLASKTIVVNLLAFYLVLSSAEQANICSTKHVDESGSSDSLKSDKSDSSEHQECHCGENTEGHTTVDCSSNGYTEIPEETYPLDTSVINFRNNQISHVPTYAFPHVPILDQINLSLNDITRIDPNAFRSLINLRYLRLGNNNFSRIDSHTFADLIGLKQMHLVGAGVERLAYDAFYFMTELEFLELSGNSLVCDCDTRKLMDWINQSKAVVSWPTCSNLDDIPLIEIPDTFFENCTHPPPQSCIGCTAGSLESCLKQGKVATCPITDDSCQLTIDVISGQQTVTSRCRNSTECIEEMSTNGRTCRDGQQEQRCTFCCTGFGCTSYKISLSGYTYRTTMNIQFEMGITYINQYSNNASKEYQELALQVNSQIDAILNDVEGFTLSAPLFRSTSTNLTYCGLASTSVWLMETTLETIRQSLYDDLDKAINVGDLDLNITDDSLIVAIPDYCPPEVETTEKGVFDWPSTQADTTSAIVCPYPNEANGHATRFCSSVAMTAKDFVAWEDSDMSQCAVPSDVTKALKELLSYDVTNDSVSMITDQLHELTRDYELTSTDLEYTSLLLEDIVSANIRMDQPSADNTVGVYDNVIATAGGTLKQSQRNFGAIKRSMVALDKFSGSILAAPPDGTLTKQRITVGVLRPTPNITEGVVFHIDSSKSEDFNEDDVTLTVNQSAVDPWTKDASIAIPGSVLKFIGERHPNLQFVGFSDDKIFQALDVDYNVDVGSGTEWDLMSFDDSSSLDTVVGNASNGRIMAATFGGVHVDDLPEPVTITFRHKEKDASSPLCVFWDFNATSGGGAWSSSGCRVASNVDEEYTVCECDHLTNFALLMDIYGTAANISDANALALSVISYVGCSVSLVCLLLTMITYLSFSKLHKDNPSKLLMNLCSALIMVMVLFILVTAPAVREHENTCKAMAGLLHYFLLAAWVWMAVEAFYMYLTLIKIFNTYIRKFILKCSLVGWGVPALIVIITVSVDTENYGLQGDICWLARNAFYGACMAPIFLIMVGNFVVFGLVIHQIRKLSDRSAERSAKHHGVRMQLRGAFAVVVLLGLTWIFSLFAIGGAGIAFHYLFAIFNSFQGLFIFIFYCVLKKDVKEIWREKWSDITSSTASSSDRTTGKGTSSHTATHSHGRPPPSPVPTTSTGTLETWGSRSKPSRGDGCVSGSSECLNEQSFIDIQNDIQDYNTVT